MTDNMTAVKAVGDWELDVLAIPFKSVDSDGQYFDENTDIAAENFQTPLIAYQHGVKQGAKAFDARPVIVGRAVPGSLTQQADGWHIRVILDKAVQYAKSIMDAAKRGMVAVSSGSISHLARLDVGGRLMQYEKNRPGRIAVWPLGEVSLWERGNGNVEPANRFAYALPAMKAMYRDAGLAFPELKDTPGGAYTDEVLRAKVQKYSEEAKQSLKRTAKLYEE